MDEINRKSLDYLELKLINNFLDNQDGILNSYPQYSDIQQYITDIIKCEYSSILQSDYFEAIAQSLLESDNDTETINSAIEIEKESYIKWLCAGVACLLCFVQKNWTGPFLDVTHFNCLHEKAMKNISQYGECTENVSNIELLYFAKIIFCNKILRSVLPTCYWWSFRANIIHQCILEDTCNELLIQSEKLIEEISTFLFPLNNKFKAMFYLEVAQYYICYAYRGKTEISEKYLTLAEDTLMLHLELESVLGKRMKYQREIPQLRLNVKLGKEAFHLEDCTDLPQTVPLDDESRLGCIHYVEENENVKLGALEESVILTRYLQLKVSQSFSLETSKGLQVTEEIMCYLTAVINSTKNWPLKLSSLYQLCALESNDARTITRSMMQMECLIENMKKKTVATSDRINLFFSSGMNPVWSFKNLLANLMLRNQNVKSALDVFLELHLWEEVIACYTILDLKHKAKEIIEQELLKKPTVKLWCLLGDMTGEVEHYETAWKLSGEKKHPGSLAQRHWGSYYFSKQMYAEALPHLKLSSKLEHSHKDVWTKLGFSALQVNDWKLAVSAYLNYCILEPTDFQAWNNLAKAYIELGDNQAAWRCLRDALKYNYDQWKVWDNLMTVSIAVGDFTEVLRCYHRIFDLKGQYVDIRVLEILKSAVIYDVINSTDESSSKKLLEKTMQFFGRLTSMGTNKPEVWLFYGELAALKDHVCATQYMQKAYKMSISDPRWCQTVDSTLNVLELCRRLSDAYLNCVRNNSEKQQNMSMLGSAKLSLQSVIKKVKQEQWGEETKIFDIVKIIEEQLNVIIQEFEKIKK